MNRKYIILSIVICCMLTFDLLYSQEKEIPSVHEVKSLETTLNGKAFKFEYLLFLPEKYKKSETSKEKFPLILFLHGSGARGNNASELRQHHLPVVFEDKAGFPAIVVSPQCPNTNSWDKEMLDKLDELLKDVTSKYRVDKDRIYLTGLSLGGFGTWNMLRKYPEWFAAFASVCGATGTKPGDMKNFVHLPGWAGHGDVDMIVSINKTKQAVDAFRKAGGKIDMVVYPKVGHNAWEPAYDKPDLFLWLLNQKKGDPNFKYIMDEADKKFFDQWRAGYDYVQAKKSTPFQVDKGSSEIELVRHNASNLKIKETINWQIDNPVWSITPKQKSFDVDPGKATKVSFTVSYKGGRHDLNPLPESSSVLTVDGKVIKRFNETLELDDKAFFRKHLLTHKIPKLSKTPIIDADTSDDVWQNVPELSELQLPDGKGPSPVKSKIKAAYDEQNFYLLVEIDEPNPKGLVLRNIKRDASVYRDDNFSFFIQSDIENETYYHTIVNPLGTIMDGQGHDRGWNSEINVKAKVGEKSWIAELAIPWKSFKMQSPEKGDKIGFEFTASRKQKGGGEGQWTPTYGWGHIPSRFGQLIFE